MTKTTKRQTLKEVKKLFRAIKRGEEFYSEVVDYSKEYGEIRVSYNPEFPELTIIPEKGESWYFNVSASDFTDEEDLLDTLYSMIGIDSLSAD